MHSVNWDFTRYERQMALPAIGLKGQQTLKNARVLVVGLGGLGCPAAIYLVSAGVGKIGLVDGDRVETSNLHRQTLFTAADVSLAKVIVAQRRLLAQNPDCEVLAYDFPISIRETRLAIGDWDLVLDCTDNFKTRYLINDLCVQNALPLVSAAVLGFEGQVAVYNYRGSPCYRCVFPESLAKDLIPNCAEAGVLGVVVGILGTLQAAEAIKIILGIGRSLAGRLLLLDVLTMHIQELKMNHHSCGCGNQTLPLKRGAGGFFTDLTPQDLNHLLHQPNPPALLDVRTPAEFAQGTLPGAINWPVQEIVRSGEELNPPTPFVKGGEVVVFCQGGFRSKMACEVLAAHQVQVTNLAGGLVNYLKLFPSTGLETPDHPNRQPNNLNSDGQPNACSLKF